MLAPSICELLIFEMVEEDCCKSVGLGNKGGRLEESEEETFVERSFSWKK